MASPTTGPDVNVTTLTSYTPDDNVSTLTAVNPATGNQTTRYLYGTTLATSAIARNDLLAAVIYPDAADSADSVSLQYNRQSQVLQKQDQNGTQHQFGFDGLGRQIQDIVAQLGTNVNGTVRRIDTAYEIRGMVNLLTSYGNTAGTAIVNQVTLEYNDFAVDKRRAGPFRLRRPDADGRLCLRGRSRQHEPADVGHISVFHRQPHG